MTNRGTRWQRSELTFGLPARLLMTVLVLLPLWWLWSVGYFGWPGMGIYAVVFLPWALRDIWRRAVLPPTDLSLAYEKSVREAASRQLDEAYVPIDERPAPKRW